MKIFLNEAQIQQLLDCPDKPRDCAFLSLQASTGLRVSDMLRLRLCDALDDRGKVAKAVRLRTQKTGKTVVRRIREDTRHCLALYLKLRKEQEERLGLKSQWLWPSPRHKDDRPITRMQAHRILKTHLERVIPNSSLRLGAATHTLRRSVAKLIADTKGESAASVWLGHDDLDSTRHYLDLGDLEKKAEDAVEAFQW